MKYHLISLFFFLSYTSYTQVGIGTLNPLAELDIHSVATTSFIMDISFSDDIDGVTTNGSPLWSVQTYQDSICFSTNNTIATQTSDATITADVPPAKAATLTFDIHVDLSTHGTLKIGSELLTKDDNTDWTRLTYDLAPGINKLVIQLTGDGSSNFPGKVAIDNVRAFYPDGYALRVNDQNQQSGYVLTSDQYGNATWKESRPGIVVDNDGDTYVDALDDNMLLMNAEGAQVYFQDRDSLNITADRIVFGTNSNQNKATATGTVAWGALNESSGSLSTSWGAFSEASGTKSTAWGDNSIASGEQSTTWGKGNIASGTNSTALGEGTIADTINAVAMGKNTIASGANSVAMGIQAYALGDNALAWGGNKTFPTDSVIASGVSATSWGRNPRATGDYSTSWGRNPRATGDYSTSWGRSAEALGSYSTSWGQNTKAIGQSSTAFGNGAIAEGVNSISIGGNSISSANNSISLGYESRALGENSITIGGKALGIRSITMGSDTSVIAEGMAALALGSGIVDSVYASGDLSIALGSGAHSTGYRSIALLDGKAGGERSLAAIGGNASFFNSISLGGQSNASNWNAIALMGGKAEGQHSFAWGGGDPYSGFLENERNRAMGFRSMALGAKINTAEGYGSMVWGENNLSSGSLSTTWGQSNVSSDLLSTGWGLDNQANGEKSTVWGESNQANGINSTAWGNDNFVPGEEATAWGKAARAEGLRSTAWGYETRANAYASTSLGRYNELQTSANKTIWVDDDPLFVVGNGTVLNRNDAIHLKKSGHLGINTIPDARLHVYDDVDPKVIIDGPEPVINFKDTPYSANFGISVKRYTGFASSLVFYGDVTNNNTEGMSLFNTGEIALSNSVSIYKELKVNNSHNQAHSLILEDIFNPSKGIADAWEVYSDERIKRNIRPLQYGLKDVLKISPKSYNKHTHKFSASGLEIKGFQESSIGMLAQELYEIIPEVVHKPTDENVELWGVDYIGLVPVLINAVKELHVIHEDQESKIAELRSENQLLKEKLQTLESLEARIANLEKSNG